MKKMKFSVSLISILLSANSYAIDDTELWSHLTALHQQADAAISHVKLLEQENILIKEDIRVLKQIIDALKGQQTPKHFIGESYQGGIVFYVDEDGQHGLIASKIDVAQQGIQWRNGASGNKITNAKGDGLGAGDTNTRLIIAEQTIDNQKGTFAALLASQFQVLNDGVTPCKTPVPHGTTCYSGWYLPSAFELQLIHTNLHENNLLHFSPTFYWSSTEKNASEAWLINFATGEILPSSKSNTIGQVRAITRF